MKYHLKENGEPGKCTASVRGCPRGGAEDHYTSPEAAREAFESKNSTFEIGTKASVTFDKLKETITAEDVAYGYEKANRAIDSSPRIDGSWNTLIGNDKRRTKNNIAKFDALRKNIIDNDEFLNIEREHYTKLNAHEMSISRAYKLGVPIPKHVEEAFERHWKGSYDGGEYYTNNRLNENKDLLEKLNNDEIKPKKIIGSPSQYINPKKVAVEYLESAIARDEEAIATRGRSNAGNIQKVKDEIRRSQAQELAKTPVPAGEKDYSDFQHYEELSTHDLDELPSYIADNVHVYDRKNDLWVGSSRLVFIDKHTADKISDPDELAEHAYDVGGQLAANTSGVTKDPYTKSGQYVAVDLDSGETYDPSDLLIGGTDDDPELDHYEILDNTNGARDKWIENQAIPIVSRASTKKGARL